MKTSKSGHNSPHPKRMTQFTRLLIISLLLGSWVPSPAQTKKRSARVASQPIVRERDVRAELGFLASDAMQGRGSGTNYERLAAEYIGSQFRQFGLEPAGDIDSTGQKGFVQRVALSSAKFTERPTLTVSAGAETKRWQFGKDLLVSFLRAPRINGQLQVID